MGNAFKVAAVCLALAALAGCEKPSQGVEKIGSFEVETLFEKDGCKVYRFTDYGEPHYFTNCGGSTMRRAPTGDATRPETVSGAYTAQPAAGG